jgi:hypothetical protein
MASNCTRTSTSPPGKRPLPPPAGPTLTWRSDSVGGLRGDADVLQRDSGNGRGLRGRPPERAPCPSARPSGAVGRRPFPFLCSRPYCSSGGWSRSDDRPHTNVCRVVGFSAGEGHPGNHSVAALRAQYRMRPQPGSHLLRERDAGMARRAVEDGRNVAITARVPVEPPPGSPDGPGRRLGDLSWQVDSKHFDRGR